MQRPWKWLAMAAVALASSAAVEPRALLKYTNEHTLTALPESRLAVRRDTVWQPWWTSSHAPAEWTAPDRDLAASVVWRPATPGVDWSEIVLAGTGEAWRTRVIVARIDPARIALRLDTAFARDGRATWTIDRAPARAAFAVNAGQFLYSLPWGRVTLDGHQYLSPSTGPLSSTVVIDSSGRVRFEHGDSVRATNARWAFQSYPTLLRSGVVPNELRSGGLGIDIAHRDARAAIGLLRDGRILVAITRFDAAGPTLGFVPFGLTSPEMAAVMGGLGATDAVMLDGGISVQMFIRDSNDREHTWPGARQVPLALVGVVR